MKKILLLCMLFLSSFCFSTDGFKDLKWGSSKNEVTKELGTKYQISKKNSNAIVYEKVPFSFMTFTELTLIFEDDKLKEWEGYTSVTSDELLLLLKSFKEKYGVDSMTRDEMSGYDIVYIRDKSGVIKFISSKSAVINGRKYLIQLEYRRPYTKEELEQIKKENQEHDNKIKNDL